MIERGGTNQERLYLYNLVFGYTNDLAVVQRTNMPNMSNLVARHKSRYMLPAFFCRPGMEILDFPCGSGYGLEIMRDFDIRYHGMDNDIVTIEYCKRIYENYFSSFSVNDLRFPILPIEEYNIIACIEGLEHIGKEYQITLIKTFKNALKFGGILVVSSPEKTGKTINPYHFGELKKEEFESLLRNIFDDVQILSYQDTLHNNQKVNCLYGLCRKNNLKGEENGNSR